MVQLDVDRAAMEQRCFLATTRLITQYQLQLLERDDFVRRVLAQNVAQPEVEPQRLAIGVYSLALYAACSGGEGTARQQLGYSELFRYLLSAARQRYPNIFEDAAQSALERVYAHFAHCHQPIAFLAFAFQQLQDSARSMRRQQRPSESLEAPLGDSNETLGTLLADLQPGPDAQVLAQERRAQLELVREAFLRMHPRAAQQLSALWMKYIDDLDEDTISQRLGMSKANVQVLRARALKKLRANPQLQRLARESGIIADDHTAE